MEISPNLDSKEKNQAVIQKRQRIIFGILLFMGVTAFSLGIFQITGTINSPFKVKSNPGGSVNTIIPSSEEQELIQLKNKDTDQDGLNDFDELYIYGSSPYVRDSDSDGHIDKEEIDSGNDPNCPTGKNCQISSTTPTEEVTLPTQGELSAEELRATLKRMGAPANLIDAMDDQTLKEVYQQTLAEAGLTSEELTNETPSNLEELTPEEIAGQEITLQALQSLDASQLRQLLKQGGVDESTLSQVDDATLEAIYQQALGEELQSYSP